MSAAEVSRASLGRVARLPVALVVLAVGLAGAQPRHGAPVAGRGAGRRARRRRRLEGRRAPPRRRRGAARRSDAGRRSSPPTGSPSLYAALVVLYLVLPQHWLGTVPPRPGASSSRSATTSSRSAPTRSAGSRRSRREAWRRLGLALARGRRRCSPSGGSSTSYLVPLDAWRGSGVPGWFRDQLGIRYSDCFGGLPENWIFNTNDEQNPLRRLTSTFLSPLATAYASSSWCCCSRPPPARPVVGGGRPRSSAPACSGRTRGLRSSRSCSGFSSSRLLQRRPRLVLVAAAWLLLSFGFVRAFPTIGPGTSYTAERDRLPPRTTQPQRGEERRRPLGIADASTTSHCAEPARRDPDGRPPPAGLRSRQRGRDRLADGRGDQGGRVDVHRDRGRRRESPARSS